ncbi:hypothetical protein KBA73_00640 [Patescibacteria group bacterium]|nr:hypothetical protein [Patescibacteria group bacterium]
MNHKKFVGLSLATLWFAVLVGLAGCGGGSPNPNDVADAGMTADVATTVDRTPSDDHPVVVDAGSDASDASADVPTQDVELTMCPAGFLPEGSHPCTPRLPPGMERTPFACTQQVCNPRMVTAVTATTSTAGQIDCREIDGILYAGLSNVFGSSMGDHSFEGWIPSVGNLSIEYLMSSTEPTYGVEWDETCVGRVVSWAPGVNPMSERGTRVPNSTRAVPRQ